MNGIVNILPAEIKQPKDHLNSLFLNDSGVLSLLTNIEDIIKSAQWFGAKPQHLYITTDEEIKEGDWFLCISAVGWIPTPILCGGVSKDGYRYANVTNHYTPTKKDYRKISATTNPNLDIPKIGINFLEEYVKEQGKLKEVIDWFDKQNYSK